MSDENRINAIMAVAAIATALRHDMQVVAARDFGLWTILNRHMNGIDSALSTFPEVTDARAAAAERALEIANKPTIDCKWCGQINHPHTVTGVYPELCVRCCNCLAKGPSEVDGPSLAEMEAGAIPDGPAEPSPLVPDAPAMPEDMQPTVMEDPDAVLVPPAPDFEAMADMPADPEAVVGELQSAEPVLTDPEAEPIVVKEPAEESPPMDGATRRYVATEDPDSALAPPVVEPPEPDPAAKPANPAAVAGAPKASLADKLKPKRS